MAEKSKFDSQLERMAYLMEYRNTPTKGKTNIEYQTVGADNKVYGILKEGNMYYIKTAEKGKEHLAESYSYLGGFNYRNENGYKSYNEATKQLELKLMSLNEAYGKKGNVSTVDFNRGKKTMSMLTEAARQELDNMHRIMENADNIGFKKDNMSDPESKGHKAENKKAEPFELTATAELDKDFKAKGTVEGATEHEKAEADPEMKTDEPKMKNGKAELEGYQEANVDTEGVSVATENPKGAKAVVVKESIEDDDVPEYDDDELVGFDNTEDKDDDEEGFEDDKNVFDRDTDDSAAYNEHNTDGLDFDNWDKIDDEDDIDNYDIDGLLEEFEKEATDEEPIEEEAPAEEGDEMIDECGDGVIDELTESVCNRIFGKKKETIYEAVDRIVAEEISHLDAWGKHPGYRKKAMTTPQKDKALKAGTKDWDDETAKNELPFGSNIGDSKPFDKVVSLIADGVMKQLRENRQSKKA